MVGAVHAAEPLWANGRPTLAKDLKAGDELDVVGPGGPRRARLGKATQGSGSGTVWLHGASGAQIRCLWDERVAVSIGGRRRFRMAAKVRPGDLLCGLVSGRICVDPVVAIRTTVERVPAVFLTIPAVSLISEEGLLCRPAS